MEKFFNIENETTIYQCANCGYAETVMDFLSVEKIEMQNEYEAFKDYDDWKLESPEDEEEN